jgi:sugar phosphate isomerase/epimerase
MQVGIFAKTFPGSDPAAVLGAAHRAGYAVVQYNMACSGVGSLPAALAPETAAAVRNAAAEAAVGIAAVSATYNMIHPDLAKRAAGRQAFAAIAAAAPLMGARLVTLCTGSRDAGDQWRAHPDNQSAAAWQDLLDEFTQILPLAERHDIILAVEPERGNVINSAARARQLLEALGSDRVRIVLDAANLVDGAPQRDWAAIIEGAAEVLHGAIVLAHAKDRTTDGNVAAPGLGAIDFGHFVRTLHAVGFDGALVTHGLGADEAASAAEFLRETLAREGIA